MVKTYLRYNLKETIGQIAGGSCAMIVITQSQKELIAACNNFILCFSIKTGELLYKLERQKMRITSLALMGNYLGVGYENGSVALIDLEAQKFTTTFFSHKSSISSLAFNTQATQLISGSNDTNVLIYDILGEVPLFKFTGHKDNIIKVEFYAMNEDYVFSLGKDNSFKIWNVKNQICVFTHVDMIHKITQFISIEDMIMFGSFDEKIKLFQVNNDLIHKENLSTNMGMSEAKNYLISKGTLNKQSNNKVLSFYYVAKANVLSILSNDNSIEFFKVLTGKEIKNRMIMILQEKDNNSKKEHLIKKEKYKETALKVKELLEKKDYNYKVHFKSLFKFEEANNKNKNKILYAFIHSQQMFGVLTNKNMIEIYQYSTEMLSSNIYQLHSYGIEELKVENDQLTVKKNYALESIGHREAIRYVKYSYNSQVFVTISNDNVKLWSAGSFNVLKSINTIRNGSSFTFIKKDTYGIITTRQGEMIFVDINSFTIIHQQEKAHEDAIWNVISYQLSKEKTRLITCSSDKIIKYWTASFIDNTVSLVLYSELGLIDSITYCLMTSDRKYLAYALMDNSIKIIFEDSQKFFLTLYGHKMPVNCFDISSDNMLLVSGSADKNVKIWGMDFGDCHKSFFAHQDLVTCVKFVPMTHFFFTASKDGTIKYFDGDVFDLVMEFNGDFYDSIWWIDINKEGTQLLAVSGDYSIKAYEITDEQIVPSFAQDEKMDKFITEEAEKEIDKKDAVINPLNKDIDSIIPIKKRMDNIGYAESLMDAIILSEKFKEEVYQYEIAMEEYQKAVKTVQSKKQKDIESVKVYNLEMPEMPKPSLLFLNMNIYDYMLYQLKNIRSSELESTLNNISYSYFQSLLHYFEYYIRNNIEIELIGRCVIFFSFLYQSQISNDKTILRYMQSIQEHLKRHMKLSLTLVSFNSKSIDMILRNNSIREKATEDFNTNTNKIDF